MKKDSIKRRIFFVVITLALIVPASSPAFPPYPQLTVDSSDPDSGVDIAVSPNDNYGQGNGTTPFTRTYNTATLVTLTAPSTAGGNVFIGWNNCDSPSETTCIMNMLFSGNTTVTAIFAAPTLPVYRFSHHTYPVHFFTIYEEEKDYVLQNLPEYVYDGIAFYAYRTEETGTSPVYRFSVKSLPEKFYTIYEEEKDYIMQNLSYEYTYDGVSFYAYQAQQPGTSPVYRFSHQTYPVHFFTIYESERDYVMQNLPEYPYDGIAFYLYPSAQ